MGRGWGGCFLSDFYDGFISTLEQNLAVVFKYSKKEIKDFDLYHTSFLEIPVLAT